MDIMPTVKVIKQSLDQVVRKQLEGRKVIMSKQEGYPLLTGGVSGQQGTLSHAGTEAETRIVSE